VGELRSACVVSPSVPPVSFAPSIAARPGEGPCTPGLFCGSLYHPEVIISLELLLEPCWLQGSRTAAAAPGKLFSLLLLSLLLICNRWL